jgi:3D-(3,5/4)-trihydroxycyclohexane-1,2-dione acylhydrolase (decyclizing)
VSPFDAHKHSSISLVGDAKKILETLNHILKNDGFSISVKYRAEIKQQKNNWNQEVDKIFNLNNEPAVSQGEVIGLISDCMTKDDTVVCAAGSLPGDMHKLWRTVNGNQYHMEYGYSCMGYEIAGGLGIRMAKQSGEVFVMVGDGSYLMMNSEIVTAVQENQKLIIVLINNYGFGSINGLSMSLGSEGFGNQYRQREKETGEYTGDKLPVDYAAHAKSMGIDAVKVKTRQRLGKSIHQARERDGSTLIEVLVDPSVGVAGYEAWWDVPVAEVSESDRVIKIRKEYDKKIKGERDF